MSKQIDALKLALEALEQMTQPRPNFETHKLAITAIKEALAQPGPVAIEHCLWARNGNTPCPHTTPPQRKPLTQAEVVDGFCSKPHDVQFVSVFNAGVRFAEAAHDIKE